MEKYDVVILGGGNAGMGVTVATRAAGLSVAMIEARDLGGTCPNRGCTPKKVLVAAAHGLDEIERADRHAITVDTPRLDWRALIEREKAIIRDIPSRLSGLMARRGVDVIHGEASFVGSNAIRVDGRELEARNIVIATGSKPRSLPIPGAEHLTTSDDVLNDPVLPRSVVFIGGGVIAFELGHVYACAGVEVTILEALPHLLGGFDVDAVEQIRAESERIGIRIRTLAWVKRIDKAGGRLRVTFVADGAECAVDADRVVNCAGRVANVDGLDLGAGVIVHREGRIEIDDHLRSRSNPDVYICGDAVWNSPQLSPIATYEGSIVGRNIVDGPKHRPDYSHIPACLYSIPAVASVGLTEAKARERGLGVKVHINNMQDWLTARTYAETVAWSKIIVEDATDRIVGAHMVGHAGEELIHIFALAMKHAITASQLADMVYGFPTFSADIRNML
ncbi:NAD(P)/FAD-dependent oxidoreductase [Mesorhizobium sp. M1C.F.Ca.ET.193.01.1.1]|uniref:dihydrolipoyl dehydrogenase family protein n=3 Tax=Mesorhizobium TaxID=68287 RepID=UPI000FD1DC6B|nr:MULTISPECIES: NAD(P)/FAD-dependent oxidoreductase [unclassified Mesorhizobium]TGT00121.1 NAD(P)/FAD-dependent oxidoreductase [bacterium M00.F.Ca.ET.177.01.1.1]TGQ53517.1 NAD(P)/FAD-dependent oxidoreductase [Mesorhizobium sp. M1C.F.Ca.ET.210.01.1.1]TGQ70784.1 NAD(P)/FAD-dependent oxidoreductase [Mesorhizobium sp. M1C.F.Ca.ET.212.01.1.1]TGR07359.1 NAD(P)/FAD-dependent oxidoreductase [Mesorhizobium sp. M1C.F.Ca.ET.204.01.1.1]TGR28231.1 NAD(P)/FAD-dependent oxidoreductase [Mesorhizobium sp. M1C